MVVSLKQNEGDGFLTNQSLKDQIEIRLRKYIHRFVRYSGFSHLSSDRKELIAGTLAYLIDDYDLIPDDVPNIGYLDDLMVFVEAAKHFISTGAPVAGVCNAEEVMSDHQFVQKNMGLMFGDQHFSLDTIRRLGKKNVDQLPELAQKIKEKYECLGDFENEE
jgi:uncharacterized membrane protein YkvA (DUF1232 family)